MFNHLGYLSAKIVKFGEKSLSNMLKSAKRERPHHISRERVLPKAEMIWLTRFLIWQGVKKSHQVPIEPQISLQRRNKSCFLHPSTLRIPLRKNKIMMESELWHGNIQYLLAIRKTCIPPGYVYEFVTPVSVFSKLTAPEIFRVRSVSK